MSKRSPSSRHGRRRKQQATSTGPENVPTEKLKEFMQKGDDLSSNDVSELFNVLKKDPRAMDKLIEMAVATDELLDTMYDFIYAENWDETREILEQHPDKKGLGSTLHVAPRSAGSGCAAPAG